MVTFDIIVPTYNNVDELKQCLSGLEKQSFQDFHVFICVDGSTDSTMEYLESTSLKFSYTILTHPNYENKGRNPTRNLVLPHLDSQYIFMIDSDIRPEEDLLQWHYALLTQKECISIGDVIYTNIKENIWADYLQTRGKNKFHDLDEIPGYYLNSQNLAMKTEDFIQIGGQDVTMVTYGGGDTEFGYRISQTLKSPVIFNQKARGYSEMPKTLEYALNQHVIFGKINLPYIHNKYPEFTSLFRFDLIESESLQAKLVRLFLKNWIFKSVYAFTPMAPQIIRRKMIHYLVFYCIYQGYCHYLKGAIPAH